MNTLGTLPSPQGTALRISRFLTVLTLALGLLALPMFSPADAGAYPMSERGAARACSRLGGSVSYNFHDPEMMEYTITCTSFSGGTFFSCSGWDVFVNCW